MKALTIRHVEPALAKALEREVQRRGTSLNQTVLDLLKSALGVGQQLRSNDLAKLAGTWSSEDLAEFEEATKGFEQVDDELWT